MRIVSKEEMSELPRGTVFTDYDYRNSSLECQTIYIKDDYEFGAVALIPDVYGEFGDYDWSLNEYSDDDKFVIFEEKEISYMMRLLARRWFNQELGDKI